MLEQASRGIAVANEDAFNPLSIDNFAVQCGTLQVEFGDKRVGGHVCSLLVKIIGEISGAAERCKCKTTAFTENYSEFQALEVQYPAWSRQRSDRRHRGFKRSPIGDRLYVEAAQIDADEFLNHSIFWNNPSSALVVPWLPYPVVRQSSGAAGETLICPMPPGLSCQKSYNW